MASSRRSACSERRGAQGVNIAPPAKFTDSRMGDRSTGTVGAAGSLAGCRRRGSNGVARGVVRVVRSARNPSRRRSVDP